MAETINGDKLFLFEQAIVEKAEASSREIDREAQRTRQAELDREDSRLSAEYEELVRARTSEIAAECAEEVSRELFAMKKQLYARREQYLEELLAAARAGLERFAAGGRYEEYLRRKAGELAKGYPCEGGLLKVRARDLCYAELLKGVCAGCEVEADDQAVPIGGMVLVNRERGVEVDFSLGTALAGQREWFYSNSHFHFDIAGERDGHKLETE